jgi:hypothetical protein
MQKKNKLLSNKNNFLKTEIIGAHLHKVIRSSNAPCQDWILEVLGSVPWAPANKENTSCIQAMVSL